MSPIMQGLKNLICQKNDVSCAHASSRWHAMNALISSPGVFLLGVAGLWLGFPNDVLHIPPLALLYPAMLVRMAVAARTPSQAFRQAWFMGTVACAAALYWLAVPVHEVAALPWVLALPCALAIAAYVAVYGAVFCAGAHVLHKKFRDIPFGVVRLCVALACLWYGLECARGWVFTGFPWLVTSAAFAPWPVMIQAASVVGAYALSAIYVCATLMLQEAFAHEYTVRKRAALLAASSAIVCTVVLWGLYVLESTPRSYGQGDAAARVIIAEGNINQNQKWDLALQEKTLDIYIQLTQDALMQKADGALPTIILWPETAMPFFIEQHPHLGRKLLRFTQSIKTPIVLGAPGAAANKDNKTGQVDIFNRAYVINEHGQLASFYDKSHLVPFGEYVPTWLALDFLAPLLQEIGDFTLGRQQKPLTVGSLSLGVLICYEGVFPELARQRVEDGANILLNLSNDGWFGDSSAPEQHLQLSLMRAVEQGRWLVRSTNTGISAIVDSNGRFLLKGQQFQRQSLEGYVETKVEKTIFYAIQPYLVLVFLGLFVLSCFAPRPIRLV